MDRSQMKRILSIVLISIVVYWALTNHVVVFLLLRRVFSVVGPLIAGFAIAFILNVPMRGLERRIFRRGKIGLRRLVSLLTTLLLVAVLISMVLLIVIPELVSAIEALGNQIPTFVDQLRQWGESLADRFPDTGFWFEELDISWDAVKTDIIGFLKRSSSVLVDSTVGAASSMVTGVINFALGLIFACYMLLRKDQLIRQAKRLSYAFLGKKHADFLMHIGGVVNTTFSHFVAGACTEAVILGAMFLVSMLIFQFPYAVLVAALVSVAALIPIVGAFIALGVGMLLMLVSDPMQAVWFLVLFLVLQQIEGNFIYPRVVGDSIGLPALWVLAAVMVGGKLFGIFGMLAGVPFAAVGYVLIREAVAVRLDGKADESRLEVNRVEVP
jgi:predicted PurR-regulated permease PerM